MQSYKQYAKVIYSRCFGNAGSSPACIVTLYKRVRVEIAQLAEQTPYKCQGRGSIPRNTTSDIVVIAIRPPDNGSTSADCCLPSQDASCVGVLAGSLPSVKAGSRPPCEGVDRNIIKPSKQITSL